MSALDRLAAACGIEEGYWAIDGKYHMTAVETKQAILQAMGHDAENEAAALDCLKSLEEKRDLPAVIVVREGEGARLPVHGADKASWRLWPEGGGAGAQGKAENGVIEVFGHVPQGYHRLEISHNGTENQVPFIVVPHHCYRPDDMGEGERPWGLMAHLYALRSKRGWGIGDFGDLVDLARWSAGSGAQAIGINPLHASAPLNPQTPGPYFPSSRLFFDFAYLDMREFAQSRHAAPSDELRPLRQADLTQHDKVRAVKQKALEVLYADAHALPSAFWCFLDEKGKRLRDFATYQALSEHFTTPCWRNWPIAFHDPDASAVAQFRADARDRIVFHCYVQWLCDRQLNRARREIKDAGLSHGLYCDMALGIDPMGADGWTDRQVYTGKAQLGAPPDDFNPNGQAWGIAAPLPSELRKTAYAPFIAALRANMAHADILRIDHVMALQRAFWVPQGMDAKGGAYVRYPVADLIGLVSLESRRAGTVVIGEDLGTVDPYLRTCLSQADILSYRVLYFEKRDEEFRAAEDYPHKAVACVGTHDLPPLAGYWNGDDIALRRALNLYADAAMAESAQALREQDRAGILRALTKAGLWPENGKGDDMTALRQALHAYLARCHSWLAIVQLDDLLGEKTPVNVPGTIDEYPNWRRKVHMAVEDIVEDADLRAELQAFHKERSDSRRASGPSI